MNSDQVANPRAVVLCAIPIEYEAIRQHLTSPIPWGDPNVVNWEQGQFDGKAAAWDVLIANTGAENVPAAAETFRALSGFEPQIAIYVGIAGGIAEKGTQAGEVIVPNRIFHYGVTKESDNEKTGRSFSAQRPRGGPTSKRLLKAAERAARSGTWASRLGGKRDGDPPRVRFEPMGSGDVLLKSVYSTTYEMLRTHAEDAVAIDMESGGFLLTAAGEEVHALVVRGVSDLCTDKKPEDDTTRQPVAAKHAAAFAFEVLWEAVPEPVTTKVSGPVRDLAAELELVAGVDRWNAITEGLFVSTPSIAMDDADRLWNLQSWLAGNVVAEPHGPITAAAENFRRVLNDLQLILHYQMEIRNNHYFVVQWYRNFYNSPEQFEQVEYFIAHAYLISSLTGEATMALNLVLDRGREVADGVLGLSTATVFAGSGDAAIPFRYAEDRARLLQPYGGLALFVDALVSTPSFRTSNVDERRMRDWVRHIEKREGAGSPPPPDPTATI